MFIAVWTAKNFCWKFTTAAPRLLLPVVLFAYTKQVNLGNWGKKNFLLGLFLHSRKNFGKLLKDEKSLNTCFWIKFQFVAKLPDPASRTWIRILF